jgi:sulfite reductase (NADPH) flavoprotein alpha-component
MSPKARARLATVHRWTALSLFPIYVAILVSGMILATHPMTHPGGRENLAAPVDTARLDALLQRIDTGGKLDAVEVGQDAHSLTLYVGGTVRAHDLITGVDGDPRPPEPPDFYSIVARIHSNLWIGAGFLVTLATFGMLLLVIAGPILSRPRRTSRTPLNWHINAGWLLYPLLIILPLSATMMVLPIGRRFNLHRETTPITVRQALAIARDSVDLTKLHFVARMPGGHDVFLVTEGPFGISRHVVRPNSVDPLGGRTVEFARMIHEGEWGGARSGALNMAGAIGLLTVMSAGMISWFRRRGGRRVEAEEGGAQKAA